MKKIIFISLLLIFTSAKADEKKKVNLKQVEQYSLIYLQNYRMVKKKLKLFVQLVTESTDRQQQEVTL